jgi:hypothetical protein
MTSDRTRARISAALLTAGTLTGVVLAVGPVMVIREALEQHSGTIDGSAVVAPAFLSAVAAGLVSLAGWHRSFAGTESWTTRTRSHQVAALAALTPVTALLVASTWALWASGPELSALPLIAATVLPLAPGITATVLGSLIATLSRRPTQLVVGSTLLGLGLLATVSLQPAFFGWAFLTACLFVTSRTLRPRRQLAQKLAKAAS